MLVAVPKTKYHNDPVLYIQWCWFFAPLSLSTDPTGIDVLTVNSRRSVIRLVRAEFVRQFSSKGN